MDIVCLELLSGAEIVYLEYSAAELDTAFRHHFGLRSSPSISSKELLTL